MTDDSFGSMGSRPVDAQCKATSELTVGFFELGQRREICKITVRCWSLAGHDGSHKSVLPPEAGEDSGRIWAWPYE